MTLARFSLALSLVACSDPASRPDAPSPPPIDTALDASPDAPGDPPDLACANEPVAATAPDPLELGGKVFSVADYDVAPLEGATVILRRRSDDAPIAQTVTNAAGEFAMSISTGGVPVAAYFTIDAAGFLPGRLDPGDPLFESIDNALLLVATQAEIDRWYGDAGTTANGGGATITAAVDCARAGARNTTLAVSPPAPVRYYDDQARRWQPALPASTNGFSLIAPANATFAASAAFASTTFPAQTVVAPPSTLSVTLLTPRAR